MPSFNPTFVILGCVGGILPDAIRIIKSRHDQELPSYFKKINFWVGFLFMVILGGGAAWIFGASQAKEALIFGYAAPEFISKLAAKSQVAADRAVIDKAVFKLRTWWK